MRRAKNPLPDPLSYQERHYRVQEQSGLCSSYIRLLESDLHILSPEPMEDQALAVLTTLRRQLDRYITQFPPFRESLQPLPEDPDAPEIVRTMLAAGLSCCVGPMAAVAGAVAEAVGRVLLARGAAEVIVENGGDIFVARKQDCVVGIFAGQSPLSNRIGLRIAADGMPCGVCCSSRSIGHSLSFGTSDAVVVQAGDAALADAAATRLGNEVGPGQGGISHALEVARTLPGLVGVVVVRGEQLGAWGRVELVGL